MIGLTGIRVLREIVESGSFSAAAERLAMSAPMVSKHLARLEHELGARLLHRSSRRLSLTEAGTLYYAQCRQALDILDAAGAAVSQSTTTPRGTLKISAPVWCANRLFAQVLTEYRHTYPEVRLDMHLDNHMADLVSEGFDVALRATAEPSPSLIARHLCAVEFHLVATPQYMAQVKGTGVLQVVMPNYLPADRLDLTTKIEGTGWRLDAVMGSSDTTLTHHAVLAGMGAAALPGWLVDDDIAARRLVTVGSQPTLASHLYAVYTSRSYMPPKLRSFIDFLSQRLGDDPAAATSP
jgi:DNA-binding transcriptional LysR family regulator